MVQTWRVKNKATICSVVNLATHHNSKEETMWKTSAQHNNRPYKRGEEEMVTKRKTTKCVGG